MVFDERVVRIILSALQAQLRLPDYDEARARRIFDAFFGGRELAGARILELGPGQYDFARMVGAAGATVVGMDRDPAVVALGRKRHYDAIHSDFLTFDWDSLKGEFDGLFCWASINPFWFSDPAALDRFIDAICSSLKLDGWGWLAPWSVNFPDDALTPQKMLMLDTQRQAFRRNGFDSLDCTGEIAIRY